MFGKKVLQIERELPFYRSFTREELYSKLEEQGIWKEKGKAAFVRRYSEDYIFVQDNYEATHIHLKKVGEDDWGDDTFRWCKAGSMLLAWYNG